MSKIDWGGELEAYHEDGRVVPVELDKDYENPDSSGMYTLLDEPSEDGWYVFKGSGKSWIDDSRSGWRIRNRQPTPPTGRLARLEAFVARVAQGGLLAVGFQDEAKALVAELNPVDPDVLTARRLAAECQIGEYYATAYEEGDKDDSPEILAIVEALRQARKEGNDNGK